MTRLSRETTFHGMSDGTYVLHWYGNNNSGPRLEVGEVLGEECYERALIDADKVKYNPALGVGAGRWGWTGYVVSDNNYHVIDHIHPLRDKVEAMLVVAALGSTPYAATLELFPPKSISEMTSTWGKDDDS